MRRKLNFRPFPLISGLHQQTILGTMFNFQFFISSETEYVELPDMDKMALEVTTPKKWKPSDPTAVLVHGLCGSHESPYLVRICKKLMKKGIRTVRINLRGCGSGKGLARNIYHCGSSDDVGYVLKYLKKNYPDSPMYLGGFSLGGNIVLKLVGELAGEASKYLEGVFAVSPPINLVSSMRMLTNPKNRLYERYFLRHLLDQVSQLHEMFPDLPKVNLPERMTVFDFDELYVAPKLGYASAFDYYKHCSSIHLVPHIQIPCKILFAIDDPIVDPHDIDSVELPDNIEVLKTDFGGHLGYIGMPGDSFRWLDKVVVSWLQDHWSEAA